VRRADGYYAQFCVDVERNEDLTPTGKTIGLDMGLESFYTDSNGVKVENPRYLRKAEKQLKRAQRRVSKKSQRQQESYQSEEAAGPSTLESLQAA